MGKSGKNEMLVIIMIMISLLMIRVSHFFLFNFAIFCGPELPNGVLDSIYLKKICGVSPHHKNLQIYRPIKEKPPTLFSFALHLQWGNQPKMRFGHKI